MWRFDMIFDIDLNKLLTNRRNDDDDWIGSDVHVTSFYSIHYSNVIMSVTASEITAVPIVFSAVCSDVDQRKHQSSTSLAFMRGIHWRLVNSPDKGTDTQEMFPFDEVIMFSVLTRSQPRTEAANVIRQTHPCHHANAGWDQNSLWRHWV